jgi:hypothetical protein
VKGKKVVALGGSLPEKLWMARARGCGGWSWLPTAVSSDAEAGRWHRVAPSAVVGGLNRRGKKDWGSRGVYKETEGGLGGATWRGGWRRALARSHHAGEDIVGGPSNRQGVRQAEAVAGRVFAM